jgi:SAM-dependent methyltransferase
MKSKVRISQAFAAVCILVLVACAGRPQWDGYEPQVGQEGKDVVWVPTPQQLVDAMLELGEVTKDDYLIDLGSGDGRTVITAAKRGTRALGVEYNPDMVVLSRHNAELEGVEDRAKFVNADLFETDLSEATVITMFLLTSINLKLRPTLLDLEPGTRIVSNTFEMGDWRPDDTVELETPTSSWYRALLWIVPAKVAGTWRLPDGDLTLTQDYQVIYGTITIGGNPVAILNGRLSGAEISFDAGGTHYTGTVNGNTIEGVASAGSAKRSWRATRQN